MKKTLTGGSSTPSETISRIAQEELGIETLEVRNRDGLDFHDIGVASLRRALMAAYAAGAGKGK